MQFVNDPRKAKIAFVLTLIFAIFFFLASGVLGYFYWQKAKAYKSLADEKQKLEASIDDQLAKKTTELQNQISALEKDKATLEGEKKALEKQIADYQAKQAKIAAYKDFLKYMTDVIEIHGGFTGWTDAEYQVARGKAQATGDASFLADVDWAWNNTSVDPASRVIKIYRDIIAGIESGLK